MTTSSIRAQSPIFNAPARSAGSSQEGGPSDRVSLGGNWEVPGLPRRPGVSNPVELQASAAEKPVKAAGLPTWMRGVGLGLAGVMGLTALAGCTPGGPTNTGGPVTEQAKQAQQRLETRFAELEAAMQKLPTDGSGQQQAESITRRMMDAVRTYSRESGRKGAAVAEDVKQFMVDHPAITITALFALGTTAGVGLERAGLTDAVSQGVKNVWEWAKEHPILAGGIALAAAGGTAYLIHQMVQTEGDVPEKPTSPEAQRLESTFKSLEERINANPNVNGEEVQRSLWDSITEYQKATGRAWNQVAEDVKAFAYEHPVLAGTIIATAGVGTGIVLERAGVPDKVAGMIGSALDSGMGGAKKLGQMVKDHPVIAGTVAVGVAAGVGYLVYHHYNVPAPAPAPAGG